jgi:DNA-binding response OmpR family regulator
MDTTILVVEDDPVIARMLVDLLEFRGYRTECAPTAGAAEASVAGKPPDLILLDLRLPDAHGLILCGNLRARCDAPIIICSSTQRKEDTVLGLRLGADDFVAKPFDPAELLARIEAVLRRSTGRRPADPDGVDGGPPVGELVVDRARCRALLAGQPLPLTPTEYRLLVALADRPGQVVPREELGQVVWGYHDHSLGRSLDVHVRRLRAKLAGRGQPGPTIVTARGFGYSFAPAGAASAA